MVALTELDYEPLFVIPGIGIGVLVGTQLPALPGHYWGGFLGMYLAFKLHSYTVKTGDDSGS